MSSTKSHALAEIFWLKLSLGTSAFQKVDIFRNMSDKKLLVFKWLKKKGSFSLGGMQMLKLAFYFKISF